MKTVYLAGPISGLSFDGANDWRLDFINKLASHGIRGLSPLRSKDYLKKEDNLRDEYNEHVLSCSRGIYTRDRYDSLNCDILFVNLLGATKVSIGTMMEIAWADSKKTPIVLAIEKEGNIHDHAMIREATGFRVDSLMSGLNVIRAILGK